jgi:glutamine cyclotransferase
VSDEFEIVAQYPHDRDAWTEGLTFLGDQLYESTGRLGNSSLRHVDLKTGEVLQQRDLSATDYGEGLTFLRDRAWVLTWTQQHVLLFDPSTFDELGEFPYEIQGWGLTTDGSTLFMSDGTNRITERSPVDFRVLRWIDVSESDRPVARLNELEWIEGNVWANVWLTPEIVVIDHITGHVLARLDFSRLLDLEQAAGGPAEMNGIAWLREQRRLFVTGKLWGSVYEVTVPGLTS